ncbi:GTPase-activating protein gyp1 [Spathaspora sp. JA1]|nr:GTPase-activating protein gyp1 [Spathaspora sp. JA1]
MGKKKQEMAQVYNGTSNEFIFGEQGGKGKHLSSFLRNLSLTGSSNSHSSTGGRDSIEDTNSQIYGSLGYANSTSSLNSGNLFNPKRPTNSQRTVSMGSGLPSTSSQTTFAAPDRMTSASVAGRSSPSGRRPSQPQQRRSQSQSRYADLDDDWDADLKEVSSPKKTLSNIETESSPRPSLTIQTSPVLDSLYPDLMISSGGGAGRNSIGKPPKESLDFEDLQTKMEINKLNLLNSKYGKFRKVLTSDTNINLQDLRKLSWNGIPNELRAVSWLLLLGYLPTNKSRQSSTLKRKRQEYLQGLSSVTIEFQDVEPDNESNISLSHANRDKLLYHQIKIDVKRTNPTLKLYSYNATQMSLRKILYLWAVRHPASGYVQGINDLCTPFYQIFLNNYIWQLQRKQQLLQRQHNNATTSSSPVEGDHEDDVDLYIPGYLAEEGEDDPEEFKLLQDPKLSQYTLDNFDTSWLSSRITAIIEADTYWCLSRLLENITDNYIHEQPGILRQVNELKNLISKIDNELIKHFESEGVEFIQFSFRWMNCLLMRELPMQLIIRMWDTYLSETPIGFNTFHTYVCAAFLIKFTNDLKQKDFQEILLFLQNPPTSQWKEKDVELMLSEAFIWQSLYKNASAHLR